MNQTTAASIDETKNDDGTITFTVKINEGLTYNNGEPITAADYVAYALVQLSPATKEAGATVTANSVVRRPRVPERRSQGAGRCPSARRVHLLHPDRG